MTDSLVENQTFDQNADKIIVNEVTWQTEIHKTLSDFQALREDLGVAHLHTKQWSFVLHADMFSSICELEMAQIGQIVEDDAHVQMREKLSDFKTKYFVTGCF